MHLSAAVARAESGVGEEHHTGHRKRVEESDRGDVGVLVCSHYEVVTLHIGKRKEQPLNKNT